MIGHKPAIFTLDWKELQAHNPVQTCVHAWVSDASIAAALEVQAFDDPHVPHHAFTNRAHRIATIVRMMDRGVEFDPIHIALTPAGIHIHDGHHRLRAYQFRHCLHRVRVSIAD